MVNFTIQINLKLDIMDDFDCGPFVYDDYNSSLVSTARINKKMYNRGPIMSKKERDTLNEWANELLSNNNMSSLEFGKFARTLDRSSVDSKLNNPLCFEIQKRIEEKERLTANSREDYLKDFVTVVPKNAFIQKHTDPNDLRNNLFHVRFNVFISVPENDMNTYYDGHIVETLECCYVLCRSGIDEHWSDINVNDTPRTSLSFGYLLSMEKIDQLTSNSTVGIYTNMYPLVKQDPLYLSILNNSRYSIEERGEKGSSIYTAENVLPDHLCNFIIKYINDNNAMLKERGIEYGNNVECKYLTLFDMKKLKIPYSADLDRAIFSAISHLLKKLKNICGRFGGIQDNGYTLRKIFGKTHLHIDGVYGENRNLIRCMSIIIVLNDDYDGGVFCFPNQGLKFRVQKGQAILFPPYWTHPHSVTSVGEGQARYTINTWILEKFVDSH